MKETYSRREIVHKGIITIRCYHRSYRFKDGDYYGDRSCIDNSYRLASSLFNMGFLSYLEYDRLMNCITRKFED